jgi:putative Holliday junction resolvase
MSSHCLSILAFDYGIRRIGVAVGQTVSGTANPVATVSSKSSGPNWETISALIRNWEPDALVVGLPSRMDGTEHELASAVQRFVRQLQGRYGLPVHTVDERLSSWEAGLRTIGMGPGAVDDVAAQVILETWLAEEGQESREQERRNEEQ